MLSLNEAMILQLGHHVFLHHPCAVVVLSVRRVVRPAVGNDPLDVGDEQTLVAVVV